MSNVGDVVIEQITIPVADGTRMIGHVARPSLPGPASPGILVFQEAYGVNDYLRAVAKRFAELGFIAIAPELYHRSGDAVIISYDDFEAAVPYSRALQVEQLAADIRASYDALVRDFNVGAGRVAAVGFCMGGRTAYLANAHVPLAAAISFYGGNIPRWFEYVEAQHGPMLCFWGRRDQTIPVSQYREVADKFDAAGIRHTQVVFSTAGHGFFRHTRDDVYDPDASRAAWAFTQEFLRTAKLLP